MTGPHDLESVRAELQRRGYLTHGLERMLLQDALRSPSGFGAAARLAGRSALLAGALLAVPVALGLAVANGNLAQSPFDLAPLVLHLWPPLAFAAGLAFLALAAVDVLLARARGGRGSELASAGLALAGSLAVPAALAWQGAALLRSAPAWQVVLLAAVAAGVAAVLWRLLRGGLFALTVRFGEPRLRGAFAPRGWLALGVAAAGLVVAVPLVLVLRPSPRAAAPTNLPTAPGERVLLVGVDGVLPAELDYLLQHGDLPALADLANRGALAGYRREDESPASFWTTIATGVPSAVHGVSALDSFRPLGVRTPLASSGLLRAYWQAVETPLRLAEYRPVLSSRRAAYTVWELAARGGAPIGAVDWWGTYPAEAMPGLVVAHGAYQLLAEHAAGAAASTDPERLRRLDAWRARASAAPASATLRASLAAPEAEHVLETALRPDAFYLEAFADLAAPAAEPAASAPATASTNAPTSAPMSTVAPARAAAVYLPGLDIAASSWSGPAVALSDVVRDQLVALDRVLERVTAAGFAGTIAVVFDPGRRGGLEGRVLLWRAAGCHAAADASVAPRAIAAGLFRALGLPQSLEVPEPPALCAWPEAPARVPTYGEREGPHASGAASDEYLQNLRSLGYL